MKTSFDVRDADMTTLSRADLTPVTIVSADGHACLPPRQYKTYLSTKYHDAFGGYLEDVGAQRRRTDLQGYPPGEDLLAVYDSRGAVSAAGEVAFFDPVWRLRQAEAEGVTAEFLHPGGNIGFVPFVDVQNSPRSHELRAAGARAHNRFLEEFCSEAPGRLLGVPVIYPWPDWDAAVADCRRARESGFCAICPPPMAGAQGDLPALYDAWWDPLWAACQELGLVVHIHAGFGKAQGSVVELFRDVFARMEKVSEPSDGDVDGLAAIDPQLLPRFDPASDHQSSFLAEFFESFVERRPLWQLMWGGVFDRFERLKVAFVEVHCDWVPATLEYLDHVHTAEPGPMRLTPSEYWRRHCGVGLSLMRYGDVAARRGVGIEKLMFGTDFPHVEGSWPNTHDWIRATLGSVPESEARQILGENAINFYGLDWPLLTKTAKRIGPLPSDLFGHHVVDRELIRHFEYRAGIDKLADVKEDRLAQTVEEDRAGALAARRASVPVVALA
jgi:predicted TIM-barrel fold metal-dependent hydrolase